MVPFSVTLSDPKPRFQGHWVNIDALDIWCRREACQLCSWDNNAGQVRI